MEDIFSQFGDIFGGFGGFSGFGGFGGSSSRGGVTKGSNLRVKVKLNLQEVAEGVEKKIKVKKYNPCDFTACFRYKDQFSGLNYCCPGEAMSKFYSCFISLLQIAIFDGFWNIV